MIENPYPSNWQDLQEGVCRIFKEIGLEAETGKEFTTPRGKVEIDVFAVDVNSVDLIKYIVECKNWNQPIPQTIIHAFTTVMHELGANIGFVISKQGLQSGAESYTQHTNITGLTYEKFQVRYFDCWFQRYFIKTIGDSVYSLVQYVEPFNYYRDEKVDKLTNGLKNKYFRLLNKYELFGTGMAMFEVPHYHPSFFEIPANKDVGAIKTLIHKLSDGLIALESCYFRELSLEIISHVNQITDQFNAVFGEDIFAQRRHD